MRARTCHYRSIDSQSGSVVHITLNARTIGTLVDEGIFAKNFLQAGEIEAPSKDRITAPVWQKCGYITKQRRKLHVPTLHLVSKLPGTVGRGAVGLSTEFRRLEGDIRAWLLHRDAGAGRLAQLERVSNLWIAD